MKWTSKQAQPFIVALVLVVATFAFRTPIFMNPDGFDSDVAVVALQSRHLARGAKPLLLWGTHYQGITGPLMVAIVDHVLPTRLSLSTAISAVLGHGILVLALFSIVRRRLSVWAAALVCSVVVAVPEPFNGTTFGGYRNWSFTLLFVALYLALRAESSTRPWPKYGLALLVGLSLGLAHYTDLFVSQLLPGAALVIGGWLWRARGQVLLGVTVVIGYALGSVPRWLGDMRGPKLSEFSLTHLKRAWPLFWDYCLPYLTGAKLWPAIDGFNRPDYHPGALLGVLIFVGIFAFAALLCFGLIGVFSRTAWSYTRLLGICGFVWMAASIASFLFTSRAVDIMSARYLVPILLGFPLVIASAFAAFSNPFMKALTLGLTGLVFVHFLVTGWIGYGQYVSGPLPTRTSWGLGTAEKRLQLELAKRGQRAGIADYWVAYRLDAVVDERLTISPVTGARYEPYAKRASHGPKEVRIFFPLVPYRSWQDAERELRSAQRPYEKFVVDRYTVIVANRTARR